MVLAQQFWIKLPVIAADIAIAVLLKRLVGAATGEVRRGQIAGVLWLLSPAGLFFSSVHGQLDALAVALLLGGLVSAQRGRYPPPSLGCSWRGSPSTWVRRTAHPLALAPTFAARAAAADCCCGSPGPPVGVSYIARPMAASGSLRSLSSSAVASEYLSRWSIWEWDGCPPNQVGVLWVVFLHSDLRGVLFIAREAGQKRAGDPLPLLACLVASLAALVVLDPSPTLSSSCGSCLC